MSRDKTFSAHYRYRDPHYGWPNDYWVDLVAPSLKEAKRIAKGWEGRDDHMTWFMGVERKEVSK